jgi:16S rRNA (guanine527-N7)-methyltransferase
MHPAHIAELLQPFLASISKPCHSEQSRRPGEACPERDRKLVLSLSKGEPAGLSQAQLQDISTYINMLLNWNSRINLTAIRSEEEIITRHFGESLFAARHLFPNVYPVSSSGSPVLKDPVHLADLGSGAGFPGIPIKLWTPSIALTLIESNHKKATFLREIVRALTLTSVDIQNARAEALPPATFNVVTLRAVERFAESLTVASTLLAPAGRLALLIGSSQLDQARYALLRLSWDQPLPIPASNSRIMLIGTLPKP